MNYTPRQIDAWFEIVERMDTHDRADAMDVASSANGDPKELRRIKKKLREQL